MKLEFSKKLAIWISIVFAVFAFCCLLGRVFLNVSTEGVLGIVTPIELGIVGFYYSTKVQENKMKIELWGNPEEDNDSEG